MEPSDRRVQEILFDFEARGVVGVRDALSRKIFGSTLKVQLAEAWLEKQKREAEVLEEAKRHAAQAALMSKATEPIEGERLARKAIRAANVANAVAVGAFLLAAIALAKGFGVFG